MHPEGRVPVLARRGVVLDGALIGAISFEDGRLEVDPIRLAIHSVEPGSAAEALDMNPGDIVQTVDGRRFDSLDPLIAYLEGREPSVPVKVVFRRSSPSYNRWTEFHVRELPGEGIELVGPDPRTLSGGH